jgi:spore coat protein H
MRKSRRCVLLDILTAEQEKSMAIRTVMRIAAKSARALLAAFTLVISPLAGATFAQDASPFSTVSVLPVHITLSAEEYAAIQPRGKIGFFGPQPKTPEKPADPNREVHRNDFGVDLPWGVGVIAMGDQTFKKIGIRYKGNGTIMDASGTIKKSFKIDLDREGGDGRFGGSKTINLNCGVTDPSRCRESLGFILYRAAGVPAPRTTLAEVKLTVAGKLDKELLGLYTVIENVDKPFLRANFGSDKGLLMKPDKLRDFKYLGDDWDSYKKFYKPKREATAGEAKRMIAFAKLVDKADDEAFSKEINSYLDVDNYLRFLATTAFVANTDSFFTIGHNYFLYLHPKTQKLHFIPWDLDRAFANLISPKQNMDLSLTHPYGGTHKLTERLLAMPEMGTKYQKLLKDLAVGPFAKDRLTESLADLEKVVKDSRERDTKAAALRKESRKFGFFGAPPDLTEFINRRTESVAAQLEGKTKGFVPMGFGPFGFGGPDEKKKK